MVQQPKLATPAYIIAAGVLIIPPFDALMQLLPLRMQDPRWRFGAFGLLSNSLMLALVGLLMAFFIAAAFEHRKTQRVLGILSLVAAVALVLGLGLFTLDALQTRKDVKPVAQLAFRVASVTAMAKTLLATSALFLLGLGSLRGAKAAAKAAPAASKRGTGALVMGAGKAPAAPKAAAVAAVETGAEE